MIAVLTAHPFGLRGEKKNMKKGKSGDTEKVMRGLSMGQKDKGRQRKNRKGKVKGGGRDPRSIPTSLGGQVAAAALRSAEPAAQSKHTGRPCRTS